MAFESAKVSVSAGRAASARARPASASASDDSSRTRARPVLRTTPRAALTAICVSHESNLACSRSRGSSRHASTHASWVASRASASLRVIATAIRYSRSSRGPMRISNASRSPEAARSRSSSSRVPTLRSVLAATDPPVIIQAISTTVAADRTLLRDVVAEYALPPRRHGVGRANLRMNAQPDP